MTASTAAAAAATGIGDIPPPWTPVADVDASLAADGLAVLAPSSVSARLGVDAEVLARWQPLWDDLPPDAWLRDGGRYRRRRHGSFVVAADGTVTVASHRAHWQPVDYNALHGGIERWFEPLAPSLVGDPAWSAWLRGLARLATTIRPRTSDPAAPEPAATRRDGRWFVEAHAFRIDTLGGIGRPTPEGAHRDGVDLVAVMLLQRSGVRGGETRVFDATGPLGRRFSLHEPGSLLLLDDARVIHETTPIQPLHRTTGGHRDTLVVTLRRDGFLDAPEPGTKPA